MSVKPSSVSSAEIAIRQLTELAEFKLCVEMQLAVWGYNEGDLIPARMFLVAQRIGGQVLGAYDGDTMAGFAMSLPGYRNGHAYLHSHMLAVLPEYRNRSIGRWLKLAQRDEALTRGIALIEWTFDPLEIKNAYLNMEKLGAISRRYKHNFYGPSSSPLQGGLPTDRLYAEWWLRSRRVERLLNDGSPIDLEMVAEVTVPGAIYDWKKSPEHRPQALALQTKNRELLEKYFREGLSVTGVKRDAAGNGTFQIARWDEDWVY